MSEAVSFNVSDVLINIATSLKNNADLVSLCGRGVQVNVGGYQQQLAAEKDAPFIWVYSDEDESDTNSAETLSLVVKIIVGICPLKDIPSLYSLFVRKDAVAAYVASLRSTVDAIDAKLEEAEHPQYETVHALVEQFATLNGVFTTAAEAVETDKESGEYEAMLANFAIVGTKAGGMVAKWGEIATACAGIAIVEHELAVGAATKDDLIAARTAFATELESVNAKFAAYFENPFIVETVAERSASANGLAIYGAIRALDNIRANVMKSVRDATPGMPLDSIKFKNQSVSHYPMDWTEITANFKREETLSL